jgi:assimilatory nitrate reductase catalytic subunit
LVFNTGRIRDQWHTMTRTGKVPRLLAHFDEPFVELHPSDARRAGLKHGGLARISSQHGEVLARVLESTDQQPGAAFSPIHWTGQLSASGRVNAVVGAANDPVSGQPEFKHAPVAVQPYAAAWHGFVMSREPLGDLGFGYWTRIRGKAIWRHELADPAPAPDWQAMMRATFGEAVDWVELKDDAAGRYRAARVIDGALQAVCFFEREAASLPPRHWLESLFEKDSLGHAERMALLSGRPGPAMVDGGRIICACLGVGEATLREAIAKGADSVEALGIQLKAGTNCGSCVPELRRLFDGAPRPVLTA